ncbi:interferon-induced GTP-binding protein Mx1 [Colletotrichum spaethianum]|uniref:Interferon-induced GTP-binding protein Mx1 n=1 Tax=Colletotrichum spaethianum TaxID=700344 RepID=A0AA37PHB3_9PEZI|nr:interferon-induced GTP-binding protein Mx1 [Colletotrichum spaethianum]GKT52015.1 interferon-induced GTP-binding protein Mx1 [Colletotrichum spaethianum]GKT61215.1 putative interferon-induced GTP-binding protein Mx1 [Colletotrichum tofieldiae]GKT68884.1 putative interferon-induced GTP-binding protein Mx1 [Colletotrichum tofieldiae]
MAPGGTGLGNQAILAKIDKLRELNIGATIPLPQLVVVGDQSSGKSSVLESLTGFSFPRAPGLCTRYATQITCCREPETSIRVSIIPRPGAAEILKAELLEFKRYLSSIDGDDFVQVFKDANGAMGIRMDAAQKDDGLAAFSEDILKIEISGPDLTCGSILAVVSCSVDIATQEILKLAEIADPEGVRTMGVLTKPDLVTEMATQGMIIDLVLGKRSTLKLGYYVVKNRSADDNTSTLSQRAAAEKAFFMAPAWSSVKDRCGTSSLKLRLQELLFHISKQEIPHVKSDVEQRLRQFRADLEAMGPSRADPNSQRMYLGKLASRFLAVTQAALNGYYASEKIFGRLPDLKLITKIMKLNEVFSNVFWKRGHKQHFGPTWDDEGEDSFGRTIDQLPFEINLARYSELGCIICTDDYQCPKPLKGPIMSHIEEVFESSRGPELGTFGGTILATVFEEQSEKWEQLVLSHVSNAIALVHEYIFQLLTELCPEKQVRDNLWDNLLLDRLVNSYQRAMSHSRFLLDIERGGTPNTFNHYFNANLQKKRCERMTKTFNAMTIDSPWGEENERYVPMSKIGQHAVNKDNGQQVCEDIVDTLMSYYKVSRKRFVDVVCQQVIFHLLLEGGGSPLKVFGPELIMNLDHDKLEQIAGEDAESKHQRQALKREVASFEEALKVLRS